MDKEMFALEIERAKGLVPIGCFSEGPGVPARSCYEHHRSTAQASKGNPEAEQAYTRFNHQGRDQSIYP